MPSCDLTVEDGVGYILATLGPYESARRPVGQSFSYEVLVMRGSVVLAGKRLDTDPLTPRPIVVPAFRPSELTAGSEGALVWITVPARRSQAIIDSVLG